MSSGNDMASGFANGLVGGIIILIIVCLVIAIFLLYKAINLVIRVFTKYPHVKALWIALACTVGFSLLAAGLPFVLPATPNMETIESIVTGLVILSAAALLITCRVVEVYYDEVFIPQSEPLVTQVLHRPWWQMDKPEEQEVALAA